MIEELKKNIETEIDILREISNYSRRFDYADKNEKKLLIEAIISLKNSMKIINNSIPSILTNISIVKKLPIKNEITNLDKIDYKRGASEIRITLKSNDKAKFFKELSISEGLIRRLKARSKIKKEKFEEFKAARGYLKFSNKLFLIRAIKLIKRGYFNSLSSELRKANINILFETYVAMIFSSAFLSFIFSIALSFFLLFFNISSTSPFVTYFNGDYLSRLAYIFWIPLATPIIVFASLYFYPSTEKSSIARKIEQELPFAVIHMSAISGSGIEPSKIFKIIGLNKEYPFLRKEVRKVLNQINLYGYDLVTALTNTSRNTPSSKLAELFSGISTTIHTGGSLQEFFEKRSEGLLVGYRLEREKYTKLAETFMDIYISVIIATPMILMLLLVLISVSMLHVGFSQTQLTILIITLIALINIIFLGFLHLKQPAY